MAFNKLTASCGTPLTTEELQELLYELERIYGDGK